MFLYVLVVILLSLLLLFLILISRKEKPSKKSSWDSLREMEGVNYSRCPLCKSLLENHEKVHSHLYPGNPDGIMHIFGCPLCYNPAKDRAVQRVCPFCRAELRKDDYVIARVFQRPGKTQVHVLGCTLCREKGLH